jgi:hypothetical protein
MTLSKNPVGMVVIVKELVRGLFVGTCSCDVDTSHSIPCKHMAALVVSSRIPDLTGYIIMPYWWTTDQSKKQFPLDV